MTYVPHFPLMFVQTASVESVIEERKNLLDLKLIEEKQTGSIFLIVKSVKLINIIFSNMMYDSYLKKRLLGSNVKKW